MASIAPSLTAPTGESLVGFSIGPVQGFIECARTVRDLWTGSYLLSWLAAHAMAEALKHGGRLMGHGLDRAPLVQLAGGNFHRNDPAWLRQVLSSCLPNSFLVTFPADHDARAAAESMKSAVLGEWRNIADAVYGHLNARWQGLDWNPLDGWRHQVEHHWDVRVATLPAGADVESAARALGITADGVDAADRAFFLQRRVLGRAAAAAKMVRPMPPPAPGEDTRPKCALTGSDARMGPLGLGDNDAFWANHAALANKEGERLQPRDRLGAVALVKRFAWSQYLCHHPGISVAPRAKRTWDTATVAAAGWLLAQGPVNKQGELLHEAQREWSGQWLYWRTANPWEGRADAAAAADEEACPPGLFREIQDRRKDNPPPAYYALVMLDGDHMGQMFAKCSRQQAVVNSGKLLAFTLSDVPRCIDEYLGGANSIDLGQPIYAGGDDVLMMLPMRIGEAEQMRTVLDLAKSISDAFGALLFELPAGAKKPTLSGAVVVAHYKSNLRDVLDAAREGERLAKQAGRNRLALVAMRRSGEHSAAILPWAGVDTFTKLVGKFADGATDRWTYQLRRMIESGALANGDMVDAELARLLSRSEKRENSAFWTPWEALKAVATVPGSGDLADEVNCRLNALTLFQTASFMARGREERE